MRCCESITLQSGALLRIYTMRPGGQLRDEGQLKRTRPGVQAPCVDYTAVGWHCRRRSGEVVL